MDKLKGSLLSPLYLLIAKIKGAPGTGFHLKCIAVGICLLPLQEEYLVKNMLHVPIFYRQWTQHGIFKFHEKIVGG